MARRHNATGKELLRTSLALFRQNPSMIWLPVIGGIGAFLVFLLVGGAISVPLYMAAPKSFLYVIGIFVGTVCASVVTITCNVALCYAASAQMEGQDATVSEVLSAAWGRRRYIFQWAVFSGVVGAILRSIEQRLGVLGNVVAFLGGLGWAVASFLVVPVLAFEELGPLDALKRSSHLLQSKFGTVARTGLRFGLLFVGWYLLALVVLLAGVALVATSPALGIGLVGVSVLGILIVGAYQSAAAMYMRTILYRYSLDQDVSSFAGDVSMTFGA